MTLDYRQAQPGDADVLAPMIYEAAPRMLEYVFAMGRDAIVNYIAYCFKNDIGFYGYSRQYVGSENGKIVVTITAYPGREFSRLVMATFFATFRYFGITHWLGISTRLMNAGRLYEPPGKNSLFIANGCVSTSDRGKGVFGRFFAEYLVPVGEERRVDRIELDVGHDNPRACALYRRLGFQCGVSKQYRGKADIDGVTRMFLSLAPGAGESTRSAKL
ncbi:MAG: GNAT family N-acetyltransferase [Ketobacteraceae bacterium]|nr:GNAT family N-acetyltransferase [Ketobacteraceae bacterium]